MMIGMDGFASDMTLQSMASRSAVVVVAVAAAAASHLAPRGMYELRLCWLCGLHPA